MRKLVSVSYIKLSAHVKNKGNVYAEFRMDQVHVSGLCIIFKNKFGQKEEKWMRSFGTTPNRNYCCLRKGYIPLMPLRSCTSPYCLHAKGE